MKKHFYLLSFILLIAAILRFYQLGENPVGLYWDEASNAYDAYSLAQTGKDQYGIGYSLIPQGFFNPFNIVYIEAVSFKFLGASEFALRFPVALLGVLSVLFLYLLVKEIFGRRDVALASAFLLAIVPWHVHFSRTGFPYPYELFLLIFGFWLAFLALRKNPWLFVLSAVPFFIVYWHSLPAKIILPFLLLAFVVLNFKFFLKNKKVLGISMAVFLAIFLFFSRVESNPGFAIHLTEENILNKTGRIDYVNLLVLQDGNNRLARVLHPGNFYLLRDFAQNYLTYFSTDFLFLKGDGNLRHGTGRTGVLYFSFLPLLIFGFFELLKNTKFNQKVFVILWLLVSPVAASIPLDVPHASRSLFMVAPLVVITAFGLWGIGKFCLERRGKFLLILAALLLWLFLDMFFYLEYYYRHYPTASSADWQYQYKQAVLSVQDLEKNYDRVIVTQAYYRPYVYFLFYTKYPPEKFQNEIKVQREQFGFREPDHFGKYEFRNIDWFRDSKLQKTLLVGLPGDFPENIPVLKTINFLDGKEAFKIVAQ